MSMMMMMMLKRRENALRESNSEFPVSRSQSSSGIGVDGSPEARRRLMEDDEDSSVARHCCCCCCCLTSPFLLPAAAAAADEASVAELRTVFRPVESRSSAASHGIVLGSSGKESVSIGVPSADSRFAAAVSETGKHSRFHPRMEYSDSDSVVVGWLELVDSAVADAAVGSADVDLAAVDPLHWVVEFAALAAAVDDLDFGSDSAVPSPAVSDGTCHGLPADSVDSLNSNL